MLNFSKLEFQELTSSQGSPSRGSLGEGSKSPPLSSPLMQPRFQSMKYYRVLKIKMKIAYSACRREISLNELFISAILNAYLNLKATHEEIREHLIRESSQSNFTGPRMLTKKYTNEVAILSKANQLEKDIAHHEAQINQHYQDIEFSP